MLIPAGYIAGAVDFGPCFIRVSSTSQLIVGLFIINFGVITAFLFGLIAEKRGIKWAILQYPLVMLSTALAMLASYLALFGARTSELCKDYGSSINGGLRVTICLGGLLWICILALAFYKTDEQKKLEQQERLELQLHEAPSDSAIREKED
jgi:hypothetical protein